MKKHLNNFPEHSISIESYYDLLSPCNDSILQFGDRVLVAKTNWKGGVEAAELAAKMAQQKRAAELPHVFTGSVEHAIAHIEEAAVHNMPEEQQLSLIHI